MKAVLKPAEYLTKILYYAILFLIKFFEITLYFRMRKSLKRFLDPKIQQIMKIMKIMLFAIMAIVATVTVKASDSRGMGLWQDVAVAKNFSNPTDHITFLRDGGIFPGFNKNLIYGVSKGTPVSWSEYTSQTKEIAEISLQSLVSALNNVNALTGNQLGYIDNAKALEILNSNMVFVGELPAGTMCTFDTYAKATHGLGSITRTPHFLGGSQEMEKFIFINVPGYEPIPIRSCFCGNNISSTDVVKFIKKLPEPVVIMDTIWKKKPCPNGSITNNCPKGSLTNNCPAGSISNNCPKGSIGTQQGSLGQPQGSIIGQPKGSIDNQPATTGQISSTTTATTTSTSSSQSVEMIHD